VNEIGRTADASRALLARDGPAGRARVVIAEDEALIRMDLVEMLAEEGYDVVGEAADGARAVELAEEQRPDLVILDVKMRPNRSPVPGSLRW
jgi:AmiR/NasT family two-component response regulator